jgi:hypothetical protein
MTSPVLGLGLAVVLMLTGTVALGRLNR